MMARSRSRRVPRFEAGSVELTTLLAASPRAVKHAPVRLSEALQAGRLVASRNTLPEQLVVTGVTLDLMCTLKGAPRGAMCRHMRVRPEELRAMEMLWEQLDHMRRFELVREAMRFVLALRLAQANGGSQ